MRDRNDVDGLAYEWKGQGIPTYVVGMLRRTNGRFATSSFAFGCVNAPVLR